MTTNDEKKFAAKYQVSPHGKLNLLEVPTREKPTMSREEAEKFLTQIHMDLKLQQNALYAESKKSLLIVLQAMDTGGKDGTIRKVLGPLNPQGVRVYSFKQPNSKEVSHDFLWRIHTCTPKHGMIHVFNRSHYEDVLIAKVHKLASSDVINRRYTHINNFEALLNDSNTQVIKFFLHISKNEQKKRLQERLDIPQKNWKFSSSDVVERKFWENYMKVYSKALKKCSTKDSPWYVIPADKKWWRNIIVSRIIRYHIGKFNCKFPEPESNLDAVVIPE